MATARKAPVKKPAAPTIALRGVCIRHNVRRLASGSQFSMTPLPRTPCPIASSGVRPLSPSCGVPLLDTDRGIHELFQLIQGNEEPQVRLRISERAPGVARSGAGVARHTR